MRITLALSTCLLLAACGQDLIEQPDPWAYGEAPTMNPQGPMEVEEPGEPVPTPDPTQRPVEVDPEPAEEPVPSCQVREVRQHPYLRDALLGATEFGQLRAKESRWILEIEPLRTREAPHGELLLQELMVSPYARVLESKAIGVQGVLVEVKPEAAPDLLASLCHAESASLTGFHCDATPEACETLPECPYVTRGLPETFALGLGETGLIIAGCSEVSGCGDLPTSATDPNGLPWYFPDTCNPDAW